jgi:hypothetical protein
VEEAVRNLKEGKIDPGSIKIDGIETEEEKLEKEKKRLQRREELRQQEEKLKLQRKIEEKERWWSGAELYVGSRNSNGGVDNEDDERSSQENHLKDRYSANYSRWEQWIPQVSPPTILFFDSPSYLFGTGIGSCYQT